MMEAVRRCDGSTPKSMYAAITVPEMYTQNVYMDTTVTRSFLF